MFGQLTQLISNTLLGQSIPDPTPVIEKATGVSWEAGMLAVIIFVFMVGIMYMIKKANDNMADERKASLEREKEYRTELNNLGLKLQTIQAEFSSKLVTITEKVVTALSETKDSQIEFRHTLATMSASIDEMNADIKDLCAALKLCPCLVVKHGYKIVDPSGRVVNPEEAVAISPTR